jgi:hypothetical protein
MLETLKKTIPLNGLPGCQHLQFLRITDQFFQFLRKTDQQQSELLPFSGNTTYWWKLEYHPFSIPKIRDMTRSVEGFTFASALGLTFKLDADAQKLFTIVFPMAHRKYKYKCLPIGIKIAWSLIVFQNVMSKLV